MQHRQFIFILFLLLTASATSQDHKPLVHFNGMQTGNLIQLSFVIRSGNTCDGVKILRSHNGRDFSEIGQLTGACGNSTKDESHAFTDISPARNADNFYQLDLVGLAKSEVIMIHYIDFGENGFRLVPDVLKDKSTLYFQNDCNDEFDFVLFDKKGKKVKEIYDIRSNTVELTKGNLKSGGYTFQLLIESKVKYTGKLMIL
jgi:hypothetical protein